MSEVRVNLANINRFFARRPLAGVGAPGLRSGGADRIALRMITFVKAEMKASGIKERTGELANSFIPIVRPDPRGGVRIGVGSTSKIAEYLTDGTPRHDITPRGNYPLKSAPGHPRPLIGYPIFKVDHPGTKPNDFIRKGVNAAIGRPSF